MQICDDRAPASRRARPTSCAARWPPGSASGGVTHFHDQLVDGMVAQGLHARVRRAASSSRSRASANTAFPKAMPPASRCWPTTAAGSSATSRRASSRRLLNSQPMGFYSPSQLVQDARRHGVEVRPVDVLAQRGSGLPASKRSERTPADRQPRRAPGPAAWWPACATRWPSASCRRGPRAPFADVRRPRAAGRARHCATSSCWPRPMRCSRLAGHRRQQVWEAAAQRRRAGLAARTRPSIEAPLQLPLAPEGEEIVFDYAALGLTLRRHPLALLRPMLARRRLLSAEQLHDLPHGRLARACGIVTVRQQPQTANGTIFVTLEDETGAVNVIVWRHVQERQRAGAAGLAAAGGVRGVAAEEGRGAAPGGAAVRESHVAAGAAWGGAGDAQPGFPLSGAKPLRTP